MANNPLRNSDGLGAGFATNDLNASAILEARSTSKGFLVPRMTETQRDAIAIPLKSLLIFNSDSESFEYYNGTTWVAFGGGSTPTLQEVLTEGNSADGLEIILSDLAGDIQKIQATSGNIVISSDAYKLDIQTDGGAYSENGFQSKNFSILNPLGTSKTNLNATNVTGGARFNEMPDADGTFVLSVNGNFADVNGDVTVGVGTGTVTDFLFTNANGITGSVSTSTSTPTLVLSLGAITPTTVTASGAVTGTNLSGTNTGDQTTITGNAGTATALQNARTIGTITGDATSAGSSFDGTANNTNAITVTKINGTSLAGLATGILKNTTSTGVPSIAVAGDFPTLNQNTTGSAATLTTPRAINGTNFDGSAAITVTAAAGTLTGSTLNSGVTASSLTSAAGGTFGTNAFTSTAYLPVASPSYTGLLTGTGTTQTGSSAIGLMDLSQTFNTTGSPTLIKANAVNTASGANTLLMDLQLSGTSMFKVSKNGLVGVVNNTTYQGYQLSLGGGVVIPTTYLTITGGMSATSGTSSSITSVTGFAPTSGTGTFSAFAYTGTINQTGGANGITRGLYVNPTLTAVAGWRSIETSNNTGYSFYGAGTAANYFGGNVGIGQTTATAYLHLKAGTATESTAPLKFTSGTNLTTPENGAVEYNGTHYFGTTGGTRYQLDQQVLAGSFSQVGTATTTFTVTIGSTMANTTYKVNVTPTAALSAALFYVNNKTTTTFDVVYLAGLTGTVTFDYSVIP